MGRTRAPRDGSELASLAKVELGFLLLAFVVSRLSSAAEPSPRALPVWDFEAGIENASGGRYNVYQREPSWARTYLDSGTNRAASRYSLRVTVHREKEGFCGAWMQIYSGSEIPPRYLDASSYRFLSFWVKGAHGGEKFEVSLIDDRPDEKAESLPSRRVDAYLSHGVTSEWQEVLIPLADFPGLNLQRLRQVTFHFTQNGDFRFYLDDIAFKRNRSSPLPASRDSQAEARAAPVPSSQRALWVWNALSLFDPDRAGEMDRFFPFCKANGIGEVYLALEFDGKEGEEGEAWLGELRVPEGYRTFLERAHREGLSVEGLAGTPEWAVRKNHAEALAAVDAVLAFNRASAAGARFDGIHFDVEPYLLLGYSDSAYRGVILQEFLEMTSKVMARVRTEPGLRFGCDIPSWFYATQADERQDVLVKFRGQERTVGEHLTDMLDSVTIMDYVNQADGAGGIIARGIAALEYAASRGKKIVVGVETFREPDRGVHFICSIPTDELGQRLAASDLRDSVYFEEFRLASFSDQPNFHIGLVERGEEAESACAELRGALVHLTRKLSDPAGSQCQGVMLGAVRAAIAREADWRGFETFEINDPETGRSINGFRAIRRMSPRSTFHALGRTVFEEEADSSVEWLSRYQSYGGLAIHFYNSFRELMEGK